MCWAEDLGRNHTARIAGLLGVMMRNKLKIFIVFFVPTAILATGLLWLALNKVMPVATATAEIASAFGLSRMWLHSFSGS